MPSFLFINKRSLFEFLEHTSSGIKASIQRAFLLDLKHHGRGSILIKQDRGNPFDINGEVCCLDEWGNWRNSFHASPSLRHMNIRYGEGYQEHTDLQNKGGIRI